MESEKKSESSNSLNLIPTVESPQNKSEPDLQICLIDHDRFRGYRALSLDKNQARKIFFEKVNTLIAETYDNYRFSIPEDTNHVIAAVIDRVNQTLAGMMMLMHENCRGAEYSEFGVSIVKKEYRGYGIQSMCRRELETYMVGLIADGIPMMAVPRAFSAHSQLQVYTVKFPNDQGNLVRIGVPGGFILSYFVEKDDTGSFVLENDMVFMGWSTLDQIVEKVLFLPPRILEKDFYLFNPKFRIDSHPIFAFPYINSKNEIKIQTLADAYKDLDAFIAVYPENDYFQDEWDVLCKHLCIIGHELDEKKYRISRNRRFKFSDNASPSQLTRTVYIESISSFKFVFDFDRTLRVITVCLQLSDFESELNKAANIALIDILVKAGFVPTAQFDILYNKKRTRIGYFSKWQGVRLEGKYEILSPYRHVFEIFNHDSRIQGLGWSKFVNIVEPEGVSALRNNDADKQDAAYTLNQHFSTLSKGADLYNPSGIFKPARFPLAQSPFYAPIKDYLKQTGRSAEVMFVNEVNVIDHEIISAFEDILWMTPQYMQQFHLEQLPLAVLTFRLKNIIMRIRLQLLKGIVTTEQTSIGESLDIEEKAENNCESKELEKK